ncbi:hypothetical protein C922_01725 [Plasmodium inui San Antonio 1]|uniref:Uncharacterized protein n=1 Tax=Plasmodium inui San Antonio 1 TaxID=1237626 RepID=W7AA23_9APIC|nr:hypothetical protein C922_01725 [Plasmodium inui San Antonio 1]EUD68113.1 hypothetical protein C922_01725 [Plasmodium inui San Antonio 1]
MNKAQVAHNCIHKLDCLNEDTNPLSPLSKASYQRSSAMGNFLGLKENKYNNTNINIFEKRYGYNLNDLHSYVYKINLPLKPRYVGYVLEEKGKRPNGKSPRGVVPSGESSGGVAPSGESSGGVAPSGEPPGRDTPNVTSPTHCEADSMGDASEGSQPSPVDIYNRYDRHNLHNSSNIYQNKLKINQNKGQPKGQEKYKDMYVHMSYDKNYIYDEHKNNIYAEDSIYNYVSKKNPALMPQKKGGVKKTYANLCLNYYNNLDTCLIKKYQKNVQNRKYKFTRLHTIKKELNELRQRYNHIVKYADVGFTDAPKIEPSQGKTYISKKKHMLLNI